MGVAASSNHVLKVITLAALLVVAFIVVRACSRQPTRTANTSNQPLPGKVSGKSLGAEGDTEEETLRTLIGEVKALRAQYAAVKGDNDDLRKANAELQQMEDRLSSRLDEKLRTTKTQIQRQTEQVERQTQNTEGLLQTLEKRIAKVTERQGPKSAGGGGSDIPVGLGLESYYPTQKITWVDPLDAPPPDANGKRVFPRPIDRLVQRVSGESLNEDAKKPKPVPVYTVPINSTLVGATGFTALVGRIPVGGKVTDPFPFKVLVGADNLAANGIVMPQLFGMVFSGRAVGDWTLSCVRGDLYSVTYIFRDGSIQSYPPGNTDSKDSQSIGWISDPYGVPCVKGARKTNAQAFLTQRIGLAAASAAAKAAAAAQTSTLVSGTTGTATTAVTGDVGAFIRNRTVSEGVDEISRWLQEREAESFDAIYVPPDSRLVVHVTREIRLDRDPQGRKVDERVVSQSSSKRALD